MAIKNISLKPAAAAVRRKKYLMTVDLGTGDIVRAIAAAIRRKGENRIYPRMKWKSARFS